MNRDNNLRRSPDAEEKLRPPALVMQPSRLGAFHQSRLSFVRCLVRRMTRERWTITCDELEIDADNVGEARYRLVTPHGDYTFLAFAHNILPEQRTDRAIAEQWDYTFVLCEGDVDSDSLERLRENVPHQDDARYRTSDLVFSRANKSVRLFDQVLECLSRGRQPDPDWFDDVGYLIRTTAVFANGKFGIADYERLCERGAFSPPFSAQMLTVFLIREFSLDLIEHLATKLHPCSAVELGRQMRRYIGVGNATGLGMAPFLVSHPRVLNGWIEARERAIARVRRCRVADESRVQRFCELLQRAIRHVDRWRSDDEAQRERIVLLRKELQVLESLCFPDNNPHRLSRDYPWGYLVEHAETCFSLETQELLNSLILEPYPDLVDGLECDTPVDETFTLNPAMSLRELKTLIETRYDWALGVDYKQPKNCHFFWYRSRQKVEPRIGVRGQDPGDERESVVGIGREVGRLHECLHSMDRDALAQTTAWFLLRHPTHRATTSRIQSLAPLPYAEIRANLLGEECVPVELLRLKLSFFGTIKYDPKSDLWLRITLLQGAPTARELLNDSADPDDWFCPVFES